MKKNREFSSFRDPSGYIYYENNKVYRYIDKSYFKEYDYLMSSGLYEELLKENLIISHKEVERNENHILLEVDKVPYISYPYEWSFNELKDAALLTLKINLISLKYNMILKDATGYNVTFINSRPIFIDTLSFMSYEEGTPWGAYGQFSRHFIAPLLLMKNVDPRLNNMLTNYIDGIPLDIATNMLKGRGGMTAYLHLKLQNKSIQKHNLDGHKEIKEVKIPKDSIINLMKMIERQITKLELKKNSTEWSNYYENTNYNDNSFNKKIDTINELAANCKLNKNDIIYDIGGNDGLFLRKLKFNNDKVLFDIDYNSIDKSYIEAKENNDNILSLVLDLNNPSSDIGFSNNERKSFISRANSKLTLALAIIHHLSISNNLPFNMTADFFSKVTKYLIIEFVPKEDSQVQILLNSREDIFPNYDIDHFKEAYKEYFQIIKEIKIEESKRTIFLMERKDEK